jgi:hypothetical protein
MTNIDIQSKIQRLELDTIKAVTELQKDVQSLTKEVANLADQVQKMNENYVTNKQHSEDITELRADIQVAKRIGIVRSILFGVLTAVITALVTTEVLRAIK